MYYKWIYAITQVNKNEENVICVFIFKLSRCAIDSFSSKWKKWKPKAHMNSALFGTIKLSRNLILKKDILLRSSSVLFKFHRNIFGLSNEQRAMKNIWAENPSNKQMKNGINITIICVKSWKSVYNVLNVLFCLILYSKMLNIT